MITANRINESLKDEQIHVSINGKSYEVESYRSHDIGLILQLPPELEKELIREISDTGQSEILERLSKSLANESSELNLRAVLGRCPNCEESLIKYDDNDEVCKDCKDEEDE